MTITKGTKIKLVRNVDMRRTGGPLLTKGLVGEVVKKSRTEGRLWIDFGGDFGRNGYFNVKDQVGTFVVIPTPSEMALLSECAEFLDGIGLVSPAFDKQVKDLIERIRSNAPAIKAYMSYCADRREQNQDAKDFDDWVSKH